MPAPIDSIEDFVTHVAIVTIRQLRTVSGPLKPVANDGIRAAASACLNLSEAFGYQSRNYRHHLQIARGSAREAQRATRLLEGTGDIEASGLDGQWDRVGARLYGLIRHG